jgi:hypothetical protein
MNMKNKGVTGRRKITMAALLLVVAVAGTACSAGSTGSSSTATPAPSGAATSLPTVARATVGTSSVAATKTPQSSKPTSNLDCQAIVNAAFDLNGSASSLVILTNSGGSVQNQVDTAFYIDTAKMRADLDVLAKLPDPTDATEISIMGLPSEAIAQYRQLFDLIDQDANVVATPDANGLSDPQLVGFTANLVKMSTAINAAVGKACPDTSANVGAVQPGAQPTPLTASYQIGQTASVGDLQVTLDKVMISPGAGGILPTAGNHFVFVYFTVENTGQSASQLNMMTSTHLEDATGKQYTFDPDTIMLDPNTTNLDGGVGAGEKKSGAVGYQLPADAGDLVWVFQDFKPNVAAFAVKASDMTDVGTPVTEPTEDAMRASADATQTAFVDMVVGESATQDAMATESPAAP